MRRRVVITGMGAITPLGHNVRETVEAQLHGRNGVGPISAFNARRFPTKFAAQVKNFDLSRFIPNCSRWAHSGVNSQFAAVAAQEALQNAVKHSAATHVSVHLNGSHVNGLLLSIEDNGIGFNVEEGWACGLGLLSMTERVESVDGVLNIRSTRGGTRLEVVVPLLPDVVAHGATVRLH